MYVLLGKRVSNAAAESGIDIAVKLYIYKAWERRAPIRDQLNLRLNRMDS
jgi:hypothetical protein